MSNPSFSLEYSLSPFVFKRRSNPSAAFAEIHDRFRSNIEQESEIERAFASYMENFEGVVLNEEDARRLNALEERGADDLGIEVASLPLGMAPGLALIYDAVLETLRSSDRPIEPDVVDERMIRTIGRSIDSALPLIGSASVTALELALEDDDYADQLRDRANELNTYLKPLPPTQGPCEHCELVLKDQDGNVAEVRCGTEDECAVTGGLILVFLAIALLKELYEWLF